MWLNRKQTLHWLPRILAISGILFVNLFTLLSFAEAKNADWVSISLLISHMLPFILIAVTIIVWRFPSAGGLLFIAFGYFAIIFTRSRYMIFIVLPPMIVGLLFLAEGMLGWTYDEGESTSHGSNAA
jgi:hypothetical protein